MFRNSKRWIARNLVNYYGWETNRKIIVIESDDWGSIRMPSKQVYLKFLNSGIPVDKSPYCRYDSLATAGDLEALFLILNKYRDSQNKHPVITANTVMANPDFDKIRASGYADYHFEKFTDTLKRHSECQHSFSMWTEGMHEGIFHPQFHGREHVNVLLWLKLLGEGHPIVKKAFNSGFWGLSNGILKDFEASIQASFDSSSVSALDFQKHSLINGLELFEELFGYKSESFIANNYIWSKELEGTLAKSGIRFIQGMKYQILPEKKGRNRNRIRHHIGDQNQYGQIYLVRNCVFEPSLRDASFDSVGQCLKDIQNSYYWKKPAIISCHRLNFIGHLDPKNRKRNLKLFSELLTRILEIWPEVEFLTSDQLGSVIKQST